MLMTEMRSNNDTTESSSHQLSDDLYLTLGNQRPNNPGSEVTCWTSDFNEDLNLYWCKGGDDYDTRSFLRNNPHFDSVRYNNNRYHGISMAMQPSHFHSTRFEQYGTSGYHHHHPDVLLMDSNNQCLDGLNEIINIDGSRPHKSELLNKSELNLNLNVNSDEHNPTRDELQHVGVIQDQSSDRVHHFHSHHHPKGHLKDFSESTLDLSSSYKIKNMTKPRHPSLYPDNERSLLRCEGLAYQPPRGFSSATDYNPVAGHKFKKSQIYLQSSHGLDVVGFPMAPESKSDEYVIDDDATNEYPLPPPQISSHFKSKEHLDQRLRSFSDETNEETSDRSNDPTLEVGVGGRPSPKVISSHLTNESSQSSSTTDTSKSSLVQRVSLARSHVPKKHSSKEVCVICGDKASGYHYNTLSCEGCKGFFRRTITRNLYYQCKYGGNCVMDMWMRRKCPSCRLKRCKQVGMREECLLTEHQCVIRNSKRRMKMKKEESDVQPIGDNIGLDISVDDTKAILASLNSDHRDLIERLVNLQDKYEIPSSRDLELLREDKMYNAMNQEDLSDAIFVHMVEMTILVTRLIVEFAKSLPGFRNLSKEDQIVLLKSSSSEVMMLRTARRYNVETNTIVFGNGVPFSPSSMAFGGLQESVESLFNFSKSMSCLYVDNAEYALLTAMCIFSVRSGLTNPSVVDSLQEVYMDVLLGYVNKRRSKCQNYLAKLLMKFVNLRTLGHEHSQTLYSLTLKKGSLPPILTEYFDISE